MKGPWRSKSIACLAVALFGCQQSNEIAVPDGGAGGTMGGAAGGGGSAGSTSSSGGAAPVTLWGKVVDDTDGASGVPDAEICIVGQPKAECVQSSADGSYAIEAPGSQEIALQASRLDYINVVRFVSTESLVIRDPGLTLNLNRRDAANTVFPHFDPYRGYVMLIVFDGETIMRLPGVVPEIDPPSGYGPTYYSGTEPAADQTATSGLFSTTIWQNVDPGPISVVAKVAGKTCHPWMGEWPAPNGTRGWAAADTLSFFRIACD